MKYLRGRPFLCVKFSYQPSSGTDTSIKGWQNTEDSMVTYDKVVIIDRVNSKQEINNNIIIDITESKIIKNTTLQPDNDVLIAYLSSYKDEIIEAISIWAKQKSE